MQLHAIARLYARVKGRRRPAAAMPAPASASRFFGLAMVWAVFILTTCAAGWSMPNWDLTAGYIAGRLTASGQITHIYDQVGKDTMNEPHSAWAQAALAGRIGLDRPGGYRSAPVASYIQTPLYAWAVSPLAARVDFTAFRHIFLCLSAIATIMLVFLSASQWAPGLMQPGWQAGLLGALLLSVPSSTAIVLGQTHIYFLLLAVMAMIAAQRQHPIAAGALLAMAAAVKISPAWIAIAWLAGGQWRAAASFFAFSALFLAWALALAGWPTFLSFLQVLRHAGDVVTLAFNNDSLATVLMGSRLNEVTAFQHRELFMPVWVKLSCAVALFASSAGLGRMARTADRQGLVGLVLVAATAFTPLAWNHYYIVLVLPIMLLVDAARRGQGWWWGAIAAVVIALNYPPLAYIAGAGLWVVGVRSHFWAAQLCIVAVPLAAHGFLEKRGTPLNAGNG